MAQGKNATESIDGTLIPVPRKRTKEAPREDFIPEHVQRAIRAANLDNYRSIRQVQSFVFKCAISGHITTNTAWKLNSMLKEIAATLEREKEEIDKARGQLATFVGLNIITAPAQIEDKRSLS